MLRRAAPSTHVDSTRERRISSWWSGALTQSTLRPARLTSPQAPSSSRRHSPSVRASQAACLHGPLNWGGRRDSKTISFPRAARWLARESPRNPLPPAMTIRCGPHPKISAIESASNDDLQMAPSVIP